MWEAIAANKRRSLLLIFAMAVVLVVLGALIGGAILAYLADPEGQRAGLDMDATLSGAGVGAVTALGVWVVMMIAAFASGDGILLMSAGAREVDHARAPQLWNVVEEMRIASGLKAMPRIYIMEDHAPNAFAVGRNPDKPTIAVTSGLMKRLNRDELQGVIAHEVGHIVNQDVKFMTWAGVLMGSIVMLSEVFLRGMYYSSRGRRRTSRRSGNGGGAESVLMIAAVVFAALAPVFAQLLYFACSRKREYLADACSARFTRYPDGLASALEKIALEAPESREAVPKTVAPMCTVNPRQARGVSGLFGTHPPTELRIKVLRGMAGGASYVDYDNAYRAAMGKDAGLIGKGTLGESKPVEKRGPLADFGKADAPESRARQVAEVLDNLGNFLVIACPCGMRIKLPPEKRKDVVMCPRCGRAHEVPKATRGSMEALAGAVALKTAGKGMEEALEAPKPHEPMHYQRRGSGWETFQCECGSNVQLSPQFAGSHVSCPKCGRRIEIV